VWAMSDRFEQIRQEVGWVLSNFIAAFRSVGDVGFEVRASTFEKVLNLVLCCETVGCMYSVLEELRPYDSELVRVLQRRVLEAV